MMRAARSAFREKTASPLTLLHLRRMRNAYLTRAALVWVGLRVAAAFGGGLDPGLLAEAAIIALVPVVVLFDARRRDEDLFLGNLGIARWPVAALAACVAVVLEGLVP